MIKATNPHTRQSVIVTAQEADIMRRSIACQGYQFEVIEQQEAAKPPIVDPPEHFVAVPPEVNPPESMEAGLEALLAHPDEVKEGVYNTPFGKIQVTKAPKGRK